MTTLELLAELQTAWAVPIVGKLKADTATNQARIVDLLANAGVGSAVTNCRMHLLPFDAVESADLSRVGWIRSSCRLCGRFLGFRPVANSKTSRMVRDVASQRAMPTDSMFDTGKNRRR